MPAGDRTGPSGQGPMTGRRMGFCAENGQTGSGQPGWTYGGMGRGGMGMGRGGRGMVMGRGGMRMGMGRGRMGRGGMGRGMYPPGIPYAGPVPYVPAPTKEQMVEDLTKSKAYLQSQLEILTKELENLTKEE